jgi:S1-C subfamily serine protease
MRMVIKIISMSLAITISGSALVQAADLTSGSGAVIGANGEVLTNAHVVENCTKITVRSSSAASAGVFDRTR